MNLKTLACHSGTFHADEVLTIALLKTFTSTVYEIVRTRDENIITTADIVIDVGSVYNPATQRFDHHQFNLDNPNYGLSSAGLVWKYLNLSNYPSIDQLVSEVDAHDTGTQKQPANHFVSLISSFNDVQIHGHAQELQFLKAVDFATTIVNNYRKTNDRLEGLIQAANRLKLIIRNGLRIVVCPKNQPYIPVQLFIGRADITIQYSLEELNYTIQTIPLSTTDYASNAYLNDFKSSQKVFVHKAGFIAKIKEHADTVTFYVNSKAVVIPTYTLDYNTSGLF